MTRNTAAPSGAAGSAVTPPNQASTSHTSSQEELPRHAIILRRSTLPVPEDHPARSFLGGLPRMPADFEWPSAEVFGDMCGMTFVAQIDLAEIPPFEGRDTLPTNGTLYVFIASDFEGIGDPASKVLYFAGDASQLPPCNPPASLMTLAGDLYYYTRFWLDETRDRHARVEFKYPISFATVASYGEGESERQLDAWQTAFGSDPGPSDLGKLYDLVSPDNEDWPFNGAFIEQAARALAKKISGKSTASAQTAPEHIESLAQATAAATHWVERASALDTFGAPPPEVAQEFRTWWRELSTKLGATRSGGTFSGHHMKDVFKDAACYVVRLTCAHSAEAAERIPESFSKGVQAEAIWRRPRGYGDGINVPLHQMLGYGEAVQNAASDHADDVLLLQVKGDTGLAWNENTGGALQLWIGANDLKQRRFESVVATFECD